MVSDKIKSVFAFIDFLHSNIENFKVYLPIVDECLSIRNEMYTLNPNDNFEDKIKYGKLNKQKNEKFQNAFNNVTEVITDKAETLGICQKTNHGFEFNWGFQEIQELKDNASENDLSFILSHKDKYLEYKNQVKSDFLSLTFFFSRLHEYLKEIFVFFDKDAENKFDSLEHEETYVSNIEEAINWFKDGKGKNVKIHIDPSFSKEETQRISKALNLITFFEVRNIEKVYDEEYGKEIDMNRPVSLNLENWNSLSDKFVKQRFENEIYKDLIERETVQFELETLEYLEPYIKSDEAKLSAIDYKTYKTLIMRYRTILQAKQSSKSQQTGKPKNEAPKTFDELFYNKSIVNECVLVLNKVDQPLIDNEFNYIGKSKGAICVWADEMERQGLIKHYSDRKVYANLIPKKIKQFAIDESMFGKHHSRAEKKYRTDFKTLISQIKLSQISQKGK